MKIKTMTAVLMMALFVAGSADTAEFRRMPMDEYIDKMKAGWIGQMAGVGWGAPTEFRFRGVIIPEDKVPKWTPSKINQFGQDDIYVEMTFLQTLEDYGFDVSIRQAGIDFANSGYRLWHANTCGRGNLRKGIAPPDSGHPQFNKCADDIDYQIEADYSGLIAPGMPQIAVELGEKFGRVMNYGDGFYAGQFVGAMYSEAFFEKDVVKIVGTALKSIPEKSQYAEMVRDLLKWYKDDPENWQATWEKIEKKYHNDPAYAHGKCSKHGGKGNFSIDAKLNGAYILMGLLYGKGDIDKTIVISMRCAQDSDCNPSNAGGILCTTTGQSRLPEKFTSELNMKGKFSHTRYDFPGLVEVSKKLVRQAVERCGGKIEKDSSGKEVLVIPVKEVKPSELIQTGKPGPIANSRYTEEEMAKIKVPSRGKKRAQKIDINDALKKFAEGWAVKNCGSDMRPGLRAKWGGREKVLMTHPLNEDTPCVLSRKMDIPKDRKELVLDLAHDDKGDWVLIVKADGKELVKEEISKDTCKKSWRTIRVDLSKYAGRSVNLELENRANGWSYEAGYWGGIRLE